MWFKSWKIRDTKETIAYYKGRVEVLERVVGSAHNSLDRWELVDATAKLRKYEQRLQNLMGK
jgi:hypothetical protein